MAVPAAAGGARHARRDAAQLQPHFGRAGRLARVAAAEDHVLHAVAAQALGALLAEHPGQRVDDVALAAAVRPDDGGDALFEGQLGPIGKALEAGDFETLQPHEQFRSLPVGDTNEKAASHERTRTHPAAEAAGSASKR